MRSPFCNVELMDGFEPSTSPLPRVCSTPELHEQTASTIATPAQQLERAAGIEPASSAWKAEVLPLNYARLPTLCCRHTTMHRHEYWWRGKDSNLRSFRGRFTVCSLWPLGNPSSVAANFTAWGAAVKPLFYKTLSCKILSLQPLEPPADPQALPPERRALCQSSIDNARLARSFSSAAGLGTRGAPDNRPARSAAVSGKLASSPA